MVCIYQSVEGPEIITTNINPWLVDNMRRFELTTIIDLPVVISDPQRNGPCEGVQNITYNTPNNQRIPIPGHDMKNYQTPIHNYNLELGMYSLVNILIALFAKILDAHLYIVRRYLPLTVVHQQIRLLFCFYYYSFIIGQIIFLLFQYQMLPNKNKKHRYQFHFQKWT